MVRKIATGSAVALALGVLLFGASRGCSSAVDHDTTTQNAVVEDASPGVVLPPTVPPTTPTMPGTAPTMPVTTPTVPGEAPTMPTTTPTLPGTAPVMPQTTPPLPPQGVPTMPTAAVIAEDVPRTPEIRTGTPAPTTDPPPPPEAPR